MSTIDKSKMQISVDGKVIQEPKKDVSNLKASYAWWLPEHEATMANDIAQTIRFMQNHETARLEQMTVSTRLYGNTSAFSLLGAAFTRANSVNTSASSQRIGFNLCASVIDTLVAKVSKNKVTPVFITNGGSWDIQQKAQQLSKFTEGCFYEEKIHTKGVEMFRDGGVWGTGIIHIYPERKRARAARVLPHELVVDSVESLVTYPRQLHRVRVCDRSVAIAELATGTKKEREAIKKKIMSANPPDYNDIGGAMTAADLITVTESWHLPSNPDLEPEDENFDGLHAICVGDQWIVREPYTKDYYPFVFFHYNKRLLGFWGQGACERLQNLQGEVNRLMILIQRSMWMGGSFKVLVENGSKVVSQHLNNDVGAIIHYTGTPPQYVTPPMIQQDIYPYVDALIAKGYQQEGVSQLSASSMKPMGLDSGKALRTYNNIEEDRQLYIQQNMEEAYLEIARQMINVAKDIYKEHKSYKVMFPSTKFTETIDWKDINLDEDQYVMKAFPMSSLANDMSGRLQEVQELAQAGMISPRTARKLLRTPDVEMADNLANAPEDLLHKIYEKILMKGEEAYKPPEPNFDLELAVSLGNEYFNYATFHECPEDRLAVVRKFIEASKALMKESLPTPPPGPGAVPPQAVPEAPPVSPMLPNAPIAA